MNTSVSYRHIVSIALPLVLSNITVPLLGLADTFVVGHLSSPDYLGAVAIGATLFGVLFMGVNFLRMGTTGLTAQAFGDNNTREQQRILMRALLIGLLIAFILIVLQKPIFIAALHLLGPSDSVAVFAHEYYAVRIWAAPATLINIVLIGWFIGRQNSRVPLLLMLLINLSNIILDIVFVMLLDMRTAGVALASLIAETTGAIVGLFIAWKHLEQPTWSTLLEGVWQRSAIVRLLAVNADLLMRTLALQFTLAFFTAAGARQGTTVLAANAVLMNFQYIISYALDGFAHAAEALVGKTIGQRDGSALKQAVARCRNVSLWVALVLSGLFALGGPWLIERITSIESVRASATTYLPWLIISPLISVWSFLYDGVFVGAVRSRDMRNIMLLCTLAVFLPAWAALQNFGNHGLWAAFTVFMAGRGVFMQWRWQHLKIWRKMAVDMGI